MAAYYRLLPLLGLVGGAALGPDNSQVVLGPSQRAIDGSQVHDELLKAQIIPNIIDDFAPAFLLSAQWSSKTQAELGNDLRPDRLQQQPAITLTPTVTTKASAPSRPEATAPASLDSCPGVHSADVTSNMTYAIILTDPDAPSYHDPKWSEFCHWIATGRVVITPKPPRGLGSAHDDDSGCPQYVLAGLEDVVPYKPPGPPEKTGRHRYVFLAFTPVNATTLPLNVTRPAERKRWGSDKAGGGVREWARENGLAPIASNFIFAQNDKQ